MPVLLVGLLVGLLGGCGGGPPSDPPSRPGALEQVDSSLVVEVRADPAGPVRRHSLTCRPTGGDLPDAGAACAALDARPDLLAPLPADRVCAQVLSGPETATVRGTWRGAPVDLALSRTDACRTAQWQALAPLLER